jgi:hypothetical protein
MPAGADITVDGNFVGNTPSILSVAPGDHAISIKMDGYQPWKRKIHTSSGKVSLAATLVKDNASEAEHRSTQRRRKGSPPTFQNPQRNLEAVS